VRYLLDINVILALLDLNHSHHDRAERWIASLAAADEALLTPWCEVGYVRVALATRAVPDRAEAQRLLAALRCGRARLRPIADDARAAALPVWVKTPAQVGDGHLSALAAAHGAHLATLDSGIPGAFLLP
jgi:uncharacterized protein